MKSRKHFERVARLPCSVCGMEPVEVHHIRMAGITGAGQKASDYFTLPLCPSHHRQFHHNGRVSWELANGSQLSHIEKTLKVLYG